MMFGDATGTSVVARDDAEEVGTVRHFVVDAAAQRVTAVHVGGRRRKPLLVDWSSLTGFGPDAVVVRSAGDLREPADDYEEQVARGDLPLDRRRILNDRGDELGELGDVEFDPDTGALKAIITRGGDEVAAARLRRIGPYCVLVRAEG
jgi:sporulation protein YlmC with PRC-barrel domain